MLCLSQVFPLLLDVPGRPFNIGRSFDGVVRWSVKHFRQLPGVSLAWLQLIWALPVYDVLYFVEKILVVPFNLSVTLVLPVTGSSIELEFHVVNGERVHPLRLLPVYVLNSLPMLLIIHVVINGVEDLAWPLLFNGNCLSFSHF